MGGKYSRYLHDLHQTTPCTPMLKFTVGGGGGRPMAKAPQGATPPKPRERSTAERESNTHLTSNAIVII